jgi:ABC-2 type transport system ATP-binding protein
MPMTAVVAARGLTKRFRDGTLAVDGLDFVVEQGQVCGLLGPNGAGKTTTLRMLLGLVHPTAGEGEVLGQRVRPGLPALAEIGAVVERPAFVPYLSGLDNLRLFWRAGGGQWPAPGLDRALEVAGLGNAVARKVKAYSQGMRQRLGIAQALLGRPRALVLDEPSTGLDPGEMREVRQLVRELAAGGTTVLLSSHLLAEVEQVCSHVVVMERGRLVSTGTVAELVGATSSVYVEVDDVAAARRVLAALDGVRAVVDEAPGLGVELDGAERRAIVAALVHAGVGVETITSRHRLEDAFLGLLEEPS